MNLGRYLMGASDRSVVSQIVAHLEAELITCFHSAANGGLGAQAVLKLKHLQEHIVGPRPAAPQPDGGGAAVDKGEEAMAIEAELGK